MNLNEQSAAINRRSPASGGSAAETTLEDVVKAAHAAGAKVDVQLQPLANTETIIRRAIEMQRTILHGLQTEIAPKAVGLLVEATIVTLLQAIGASRR